MAAVFGAAALTGVSLCWLLVWTCGTDIAATVTNAYQVQSPKGRTRYVVDVQYGIGGKQYETSHQVSAATFQHVTRFGVWAGGPATVKVRHLDFGSRHFHLFSEEGLRFGYGPASLVISPIVDLAVGVVIFRAWILPARRRQVRTAFQPG